MTNSLVRNTAGLVRAWAAVLALVCFAGLLPAQSATRAHDPQKAEVLTIPLLPQGFAAPEIILEAGAYWINISNRSTVQDIRFEIDRMPGKDLAATPLKQEAAGVEDRVRANFLRPLRLTQGTYRVRVVDHPDWVCAITVK
jgi:hypothetical protein